MLGLPIKLFACARSVLSRGNWDCMPAVWTNLVHSAIMLQYVDASAFRRSCKTAFMDEKDRLLWTYLHNGLSRVRQPFDQLAAKAGLDTAEVFVRIQRFKKEGTLTEIQPVWDPRKFHYQSVWVAMRFDPANLISKAGSFTEHPGVIYACERNDVFNLWFFIAVPAEHDLELHVRCLEKMSGAEQTLFLPVRKVFKGTDLLNVLDDRTFLPIGERFDNRGKKRLSELTPEEIEMVRGLRHFPLTDEPFKKLAGELGLTEDQVLERLRSLAQKGCLRRIGSFLPSLSVAKRKKTLVVWKIPEENIERIGNEFAEFGSVLYVDQRTSFPAFPYSLYTVFQSDSPAEFEVAIRHIEDHVGKWPRKLLATAQEFKKDRLNYFSEELEAWWRRHRTTSEDILNGVGI